MNSGRAGKIEAVDVSTNQPTDFVPYRRYDLYTLLNEYINDADFRVNVHDLFSPFAFKRRSMTFLLNSCVILSYGLLGVSRAITPDEEYFVDGSSVTYVNTHPSGYRERSLVMGVDAKTFKTQKSGKDWLFGVDKNYVYFHGSWLVGSDPESFSYVGQISEQDRKVVLFNDKNNAYLLRSNERSMVIIFGIDKTSFELVSINRAEDATQVFTFFPLTRAAKANEERAILLE